MSEPFEWANASTNEDTKTLFESSFPTRSRRFLTHISQYRPVWILETRDFDCVQRIACRLLVRASMLVCVMILVFAQFRTLSCDRYANLWSKSYSSNQFGDSKNSASSEELT